MARGGSGLRLRCFDVCFPRGLSLFLPGLAVEAEAEEVHVGRGVDDAEGAVDFEGVDAGFAVEALREDALEDVAGGDVLLGFFDGAEEVARAWCVA